MRLNKIVAATMASTMVLSLAACGGSGDTATTAAGDAATTAAGDAAAETTAAEGETAASGEQVELSITTWDYEASPQFSAIVEAYEAQNPNVKIKVIDTSADEYNNSLGISLSAAAADPDVIFVKDMGSMLQMADKNQLMPLDDFIAQDSIDTEMTGMFCTTTKTCLMQRELSILPTT